MLIDCFTLDAGKIALRKFIDTDNLEPSDIEYFQKLLQRLKGGEKSISIVGEPPADVKLALGLPSADWFHNAMVDENFDEGEFGEMIDNQELEELVEDYVAISIERLPNIFRLDHGDSGVVNLVIPFYQTEPLHMLEGFVAATYARSQIKDQNSRIPNENVMEDVCEKHEEFKRLAHEIWEARPAIVFTQSWGAEWDDFAENIGTALLLHLESTHD